MIEETGLITVYYKREKEHGFVLVGKEFMEQYTKETEINIGSNIRQIRKMKKIGQTELARMVQNGDVHMTREILVKIERGIQHITAVQLRAIRDCLDTTYDELLKEIHS